MTSHHVSVNIDTLLNKSDNKLQEMFGGFGPDIRSELESRKANGERLIGSLDCVGFCPVNGCPGHQDSEVNHG
jgi:hypothetical protein